TRPWAEGGLSWVPSGWQPGSRANPALWCAIDSSRARPPEYGPGCAVPGPVHANGRRLVVTGSESVCRGRCLGTAPANGADHCGTHRACVPNSVFHGLVDAASFAWPGSGPGGRLAACGAYPRKGGGLVSSGRTFALINAARLVQALQGGAAQLTNAFQKVRTHIGGKARGFGRAQNQQAKQGVRLGELQGHNGHRLRVLLQISQELLFASDAAIGVDQGVGPADQGVVSQHFVRIPAVQADNRHFKNALQAAADQFG